MKVIVAHPGRQHSYRLASALKKSGDLLYYITTVYEKNNSWFLKFIKPFLSKDNKKRANNQRNEDLSDREVLTFGEFGGLIEKLLVRIDPKRYFYDRVHQFNSYRFGIKVAKIAVKTNADIVICYDSNATSCFAYLKEHAPHIVRVLDVSIAARHYMREIYNKEIAKCGAQELKNDNPYMWNENQMAPLLQEIKDTQYFLSASNFVKDSLVFCGVDSSQVKLVPYGANVNSNVVRNTIKKEERIEFLFVGQVVYRKGIPYAIEAIKRFDSDIAHLTITGQYKEYDSFIQENINDNHITFTGLVTIDKMREIYERAHVFILPSFAEGMAQVGVEAMACGLPIICTYNSGVADLVTEGVNGFIIPVGDKDALIEKMQWFIDNPDKIKTMGEAASNIGKKYSWDRYSQEVVEVLHALL